MPSSGPPTVCLQADITHKHQCRIPGNVTTWSIHGLWPSRHKGESPSFCNRSAKFDPSAIRPIENLLLKFWPNLYTDEPLLQFWEHEWNKHGTCAMVIPSLSSEYKYFNTGIKINNNLDVLGSLQKQGVVPKDDSTYPYTTFVMALKKAFGHTTLMGCYYDVETKTQHIISLEVCFNKQLQMIDCIPAGSTCRSSEPIAYTAFPQPRHRKDVILTVN
ncbi:Ribonuclease 1 [Lamellibrachia satsuma]|nr:Ribonuclease 1 [Lamellibrachia satsuma]